MVHLLKRSEIQKLICDININQLNVSYDNINMIFSPIILSNLLLEFREIIQFAGHLLDNEYRSRIYFKFDVLRLTMQYVSSR